MNKPVNRRIKGRDVDGLLQEILHVRYPLSVRLTDNRLYCKVRITAGETEGTYFCTREEGHTGIHIASTLVTGQILRISNEP